MACQGDYSEGDLRLIKSVERELAKDEIKFIESLKKGQHHWLTYQIIKMDNRLKKLERRIE